MYPLHVGLYSYTSGLERLCKLTIACHGFLATGAFSSVRSYGHKISDLLDGVEDLNFSEVPKLDKPPPNRPVDGLDATLIAALDRFANGAGRYEHLDSLSNIDVDVTTLDTWTELCADVTPSSRVHHVLSMRQIVIERIRVLCTHGQLEGSAYAILESADPYLSELSTAVALRLYEKARWVSLTLDALTYYTHRDLPLLGEAVEDIRPPAESCFQRSIAQIEDERATIEDLDNHFEHFAHLDDE